MHCSVDFKLKSQTFNFELETFLYIGPIFRGSQRPFLLLGR